MNDGNSVGGTDDDGQGSGGNSVLQVVLAATGSALGAIFLIRCAWNAFKQCDEAGTFEVEGSPRIDTTPLFTNRGRVSAGGDLESADGGLGAE